MNGNNNWDVSVNVYMSNKTGDRFNINTTYNIPITEFATLDRLTQAVNNAVREFTNEENK